MIVAKHDKFHGMKIVSDNDCVSVRDQNVIELNSSCNLVCRYYDENGLEEDDPFEIDIFEFCIDSDEENIIKSIKEQTGINKFIISESAVDFIKNFASLKN